MCKCWIHKRCNEIRGRLKQDNKIKCWISPSHDTDASEERPIALDEFNDQLKFKDQELNHQSFEIEKLFYFGDIIGARRFAVDNVFPRLRN